MPHTVTVYNVGEEDLLTGVQINNITVLRGVFLDAEKASNVRQSGLAGADAVNLYIPFDVDAVDGLTQAAKQYVGPKEYEMLNSVEGHWTLDVGDDCFFVKGEIVEPGRDFQYINNIHDHVYTVTKVDEKDFGSLDMQHWEVGGS